MARAERWYGVPGARADLASGHPVGGWELAVPVAGALVIGGMPRVRETLPHVMRLRRGERLSRKIEGNEVNRAYHLAPANASGFKSADGNGKPRYAARVGAMLRMSISPRVKPAPTAGPAMKNEASSSGWVGA